MENEKVDNIVEEESRFKKELFSLKSKTLFLLVIILSFLGITIGYYVSGGVLKSDFSNVSFDQISKSSIDISFDTAEPTKTKIMYGTTDMYMNEKVVNSKFSTQHTVRLDSILPGVLHKFRFIAEDVNGNQHVSKMYEF